MVKARGWTRLAELGVFEGTTARYLLATCPELHWWGVDTWQAGDPSADVPEHLKKTDADTGHRSYAQHPLDRYYERVLLMREEFYPRATVMPMTTAEAAQRMPDSMFDCVFIDADHTPEGVEADIRDWASKIRPGGVLAGHDHNLPALRAVLNRLLPGWHAEDDDSVWWIEVERVRL